MNRTRTFVGKTLLVAGTLFLGACDRQETPSETAEDVAAARADGQEEIADATQAANKSAAESARDIANADDTSERREAIADAHESAGASAYDVRLEKAEADRDIAKQKCDSLPASQQDACENAAEAAYNRAKDAAKRGEDAMEKHADQTREKP